MFFNIIYINHNPKWLAGLKKPIILENKFKKQIFGRGKIVFQKKNKEGNKVWFVYILKQKKLD